MKRLFVSILFCVLFLTITGTRCYGQTETKDSIGEIFFGPQEFHVDMNETDPYFAVTKDTVSPYGPLNITRNILQDRNGNFWLATWEGVIRYDGKVFTNFTLKEGLRKFHVFSVPEDKAGNLWFGTIRGGVYRYDGVSFRLFTTGDGLADNIVTCMWEDKEGNIWFGTDNGASRYNPSADRPGYNAFTNFTTENGLSGSSVNAIVQDKSGKIWFGTRYGTGGDLSIYDPSVENERSFTAFANKEGIVFLNVRSVIQDKNGNIWIGSQNGLFRYDGESLAQVSKRFTGYIFEDKTGTIWTSEDDVYGMALYRYDGDSSEKIVVSPQLFGIMEDTGGKIWYGTMNGVYRYDPATGSENEKAFTNFTD